MIELLKALCKAQAEFPKITKRRTAKVTTKTGREYSYNYADLADINEAITTPLLRNGFLIIHTEAPDTATSRDMLYTRIYHAASGQSLVTSCEMPTNVDPQDRASYLTYYKRYSICNLLNIAAEDDDDAQIAKGSITSPVAPQSKADNPSTIPLNPKVKGPSDAQIKRLNAIANAHGWDHSQVTAVVKDKYKLESTKSLNQPQYQEMCDFILLQGPPKTEPPKPLGTFDEEFPFDLTDRK